MPPGNVPAWTLAETMEKEREAFGFYFAAHPLSAWRHVLDVHGARSYAQVTDGERPDGGRGSAMMAGLVESVRWRTPQSGRGGRSLIAPPPESSGQSMERRYTGATRARRARRAELRASDGRRTAGWGTRFGDDGGTGRVGAVANAAVRAGRTLPACDAVGCERPVHGKLLRRGDPRRSRGGCGGERRGSDRRGPALARRGGDDPHRNPQPDAARGERRGQKRRCANQHESTVRGQGGGAKRRQRD